MKAAIVAIATAIAIVVVYPNAEERAAAAAEHAAFCETAEAHVFASAECE